MSIRKFRVLFLCTGNSCRSQMAEGWAKHLGGGIVEVESAGIESHGKNPRAIAVMYEAGVDISGQESTRVTDEMIARADIVVTVCGHADEHCPMLPPGKRKSHWPMNLKVAGHHWLRHVGFVPGQLLQCRLLCHLHVLHLWHQ